MKKRNKDNNIKDILILLGIILVVSVIVIFIVKGINKNIELNSGEWTKVYDEDVSTVGIATYSPSVFYTDVFNSISSNSDNQYVYVFPEDVRLNTMSFGLFSLYGSNMEVIFHNITIDDFDEFEKNMYSIRKIQYTNVMMEKKTVDISGTKAYVYLNKCSDGTSYIEELNMYIQESDSSYLEVSYVTHQNKFTDSFINKVIKSFEIKEGQAVKESCSINDGKYNCELDMGKYNGINKVFNFNVDSTKYEYEYDDAHYIKDSLYFVKAYDDPEDVDINWENVTISIVYNRKTNIMKYLSKYDEGYNIISDSDVNINGKNLHRVEYEVEEGFANETYYVDKLSDHLAIVIYVVSPDNTDEVVKEFLDYSFK